MLTLHRPFCKWGNSDEQGDKVFGWNICVSFLHEQMDQQQDKKLYFDRQKEAQRIQSELHATMEQIKQANAASLRRFSQIKELSLDSALEDCGELQSLLARKKGELSALFQEMDQAVVKRVKQG